MIYVYNIISYVYKQKYTILFAFAWSLHVGIFNYSEIDN